MTNDFGENLTVSGLFSSGNMYVDTKHFKGRVIVDGVDVQARIQELESANSSWIRACVGCGKEFYRMCNSCFNFTVSTLVAEQQANGTINKLSLCDSRKMQGVMAELIRHLQWIEKRRAA